MIEFSFTYEVDKNGAISNVRSPSNPLIKVEQITPLHILVTTTKMEKVTA